MHEYQLRLHRIERHVAYRYKSTDDFISEVPLYLAENEQNYTISWNCEGESTYAGSILDHFNTEKKLSFRPDQGLVYTLPSDDYVLLVSHCSSPYWTALYFRQLHWLLYGKVTYR